MPLRDARCLLVLLTACGSTSRSPAPPAPPAPAIEAPAAEPAPAVAEVPDVGITGSTDLPDAAVAAPTMAPHVPAIVRGGFDVVVRDATTGEARVARARVLPIDRVAPDQRATGEPVRLADDLPRGEPPFTALASIAYGKRAYLGLVEANSVPSIPPELDDPDHPRAIETPLLFAATGRPHPIGALRWRVWAGVNMRAMMPDLLVIEDGRGTPRAVRYLGAQAAITPLTVGGTTLFVVERLDQSSGIDDPVTFDVIAVVDGGLVGVLQVAGGPRWYADDHRPAHHLGPPGSVTAIAHGLRVREVNGAFNTCTPGTLRDPGCDGEERDYTWSPADKRLVLVGTPRPIVARLGAQGMEIRAAVAAP
jgi:hypothetical protein